VAPGLPGESTLHSGESHIVNLGDRLNWLRAGVLGANDGLLSTAGVVVGVAGATAALAPILTAGIAALVAGSLSMAGGEYVSVSTQRDTEEAALAKERWELANLPIEEEEELARIYQARGLTEDLAKQVSRQLMQTDALTAHAEAELQIDPNALTSPWHAAGASFLAFAVGGLVPTLAILLPVDAMRVLFCIAMVTLGLVVTGALSAHLGAAPPQPAVIRNVAVGVLTMAITWLVGRLTGSLI